MADRYPATVTFGPVPSELAEALVEGLAHPIADRIMAITGHPEEVVADRHGMVRIHDPEAAWGLGAWGFFVGRADGESLDDVLTELGYGWDAHDLGTYDQPGRRVFWRLGWGHPRVTGWAVDQPVLSRSVWEGLWHALENRSGVGELIHEYFGEELPFDTSALVDEMPPILGGGL